MAGNVLYGMTYHGGAYSGGLVFSIHTDGTEYKDLLDFNGPNGDGPGVYEARGIISVFDTAGTFYSDTSCPGGGHRPIQPAAKSDFPSVYTSINIYPNPNNGNFTLEYNLGNQTSGEVMLFNMLGGMVGKYSLNSTEGKMSISNPELSNGVYIWKLYTNTGVLQVGKVIIMK